MIESSQGSSGGGKVAPGSPALSGVRCDPAEMAMIQSCLDRDEEAWRQFLDRYRPIFYKTIYKTLTSMNLYHRYSSQVDDIYLECMRSILMNLEKFSGRCALRTWLIVCIRNFTYNEVRKLERKTVPDEVDTPIEDMPISDPEPPGQDVEVGEVLRKMEERLSERLSDKGMIFYELIFRRDLAVDEISRTMKVSPEGVRVWKKRIRDTMKELYVDLTA